MRYISTRGGAEPLSFADVLLEGLASDGGLFVPESWPALPSIPPGASYVDTAFAVMWPFVEGSLSKSEFAEIISEAYATFHTPPGSEPDVVPVSEVGDNQWLAEIYWGPTLAFKDIAMQLLGRLFDHELDKRGERITIVGATSGDTGSAAIDACKDREHIDIFILHPYGRTSEVQRRQMTTVTSANVHNLAIDGTFDDCQDIVKALFADEAFRREQNLSAVNSINWARVMAQIVYYVTSAGAVNQRLGREATSPVSFCVPTGNFGNVFAGYGAMQMGLAVDQLVIASNTNDILTRFFESGVMALQEVVPTLSPSMDIQVSSNFERLLFDMVGRDGSALSEMMMQFRGEGSVSVEQHRLDWLSERFVAGRYSDEQCVTEMAAHFERTGVQIDPHTAVGLGVGRSLRRSTETPLICLGTAHPAKFPDAVKQATGHSPELPVGLSDLFERPERFERCPNDVAAVRQIVRANVSL
jgi:threonine synthase